jgi:hypothetical protein
VWSMTLAGPGSHSANGLLEDLHCRFSINNSSIADPGGLTFSNKERAKLAKADCLHGTDS